VSDYVTIANVALDHLGEEDQLASPDDDIKSARTIKAVWVSARQMLLRENNWNFATKRAQLPALNSAPAFGYSNAFQLPSDFMKLVDVVGPVPGNQDWIVEGNQILADVSGPLQIRYVADTDNTEIWDAQFTDAFSWLIASRICIRLTGDRSLKQDMEQGFARALQASEFSDAVENPPIEFDVDPWIVARGSYSGFFGG
jgi:hypothetical protein